MKPVVFIFPYTSTQSGAHPPRFWFLCGPNPHRFGWPALKSSLGKLENTLNRWVWNWKYLFVIIIPANSLCSFGGRSTFSVVDARCLDTNRFGLTCALLNSCGRNSAFYGGWYWTDGIEHTFVIDQQVPYLASPVKIPKKWRGSPALPVLALEPPTSSPLRRPSLLRPSLTMFGDLLL